MAIGNVETEPHFMKGTGVTIPNLGKKRTCQSCEARFFDLNKNPAICPKCHDKNKIPTTKARRAAPSEPKAASVKTPEVEDVAETSNAAETTTEPGAGDSEEETDELEAELVDDLDEGLMENTSELDEDNDELSEVLEHVNDDVGDK